MGTVENYEKMNYQRFMQKAERDKALQTLNGIVEGIALDNEISSNEVLELKNWIIVNEFLGKYKPFDELIDIVEGALDDNVLTEDEFDDITWAVEKFSGSGEYYEDITLRIQRLEGLLHGIMADNKISDEEILELDRWMSENDFILKGTFPYEEIRTLLINVLSDGIVTENERDLLKACFSEFVDLKTSYNISEREMRDLQELYSIGGICCTNPDITISGKLFSFTGKSSHATRSEIAHQIVEHGGSFKNNVIKSTNYLIVGDDGNPCWAYSCYGRKVEQAMDLRKNGSTILIVHENDLWRKMENSNDTI